MRHIWGEVIMINGAVDVNKKKVVNTSSNNIWNKALSTPIKYISTGKERFNAFQNFSLKY